ncbi:DnaJ family domain-containing protein [Chitinolyticbacter albus]|uniref:DnaJ family domain-containing protein n=1 Tax=Chitinolyticbacter albus TaxID=2961951 RepID=UPI00210DE4AD|nr:DnaJ family domain-containing protein [Chitinolyticbacter albus]
MWWVTELAERRIAEAQRDGAFDNLPGIGQPLPADEIDLLVPEHQRIAYRVLKNSGYLPPELETHRDAVELALQLATAEADTRPALLERLARLNRLLEHGGHRALAVPVDYATRLAEWGSARRHQ